MTVQQMDGAPAAPADIYGELSAATPEARAAIVLRAIHAHPEGRLELPANSGRQAALAAIDLSSAAVAPQDVSPASLPPWWDREHGRIILRGAALNGADLDRANLSGADLSSADLTGASLRAANLQDAVLEGASMQHADLVDATLQGAALSICRTAPSRIFIWPGPGSIELASAAGNLAGQ